MLQPDSLHTITKSVSALPDTVAHLDSLARLDSLAKADSLHVVDSLRAVALIPRGFVGVPHPSLPQNESWVFIVLFVLFFLLVLAVSQSSGFISETIKTFFQVKERSSIFSKATVNDFQFKLFLNIFSLGVLSLYVYLILFKPGDHFVFKEYCFFYALTALFLFLKSFLFNFLGYVFLTPVSLKMAKESYFNVVSFLGIVLYPLLILQIYIQNNAYIIQSVSLVMCIIACILVIIKLFQIFSHKTVASFYILLYLCTLEFLPLLGLFQVYNLILFSV